MIVKNESHIIRQTLEHLMTIFPITYWVIDDTGSTDGTQELIHSFFATRGISGELHETPWRNFGWNRTQAFQHAYNKTDYVLVWDADDSVSGKLTLPPTPWAADVYKLIFGNSGGFRYHRLQLFNNRRRWRYVGVLHEYPAPAEGEARPVKEEIIAGDYFCESGRAGARNQDPHKYSRDAEVLEQGLRDEPTNARYAFYCANSYKDANLPDKAIEMYKRVLTMNGWAEEKYLACVRIWELSSDQNKDAHLHYLIESHQHVADRVEGIQHLIEHYCIKQQNSVALAFYGLIQDYYENRYLTDRPNLSRHLFVTRSTYDYDLPYYVIISALHSDKQLLALKMFDMIFRCGFTQTTHGQSNSLFFNLQVAIPALSFSPLFTFDFLQRLLAYREALPHCLEDRSEAVIDRVVEMYRPQLTSSSYPELTTSSLPQLIVRDIQPTLSQSTTQRILCSMTTCKRLDLFRQTMRSMLRCWKDFNRITEFLIVDDNSSEKDRLAMLAEFPFVTFRWKTPAEAGHRQSMNHIWNHLSKTRPDFWIHLEDDWLFYRERSYVTDAIEFLDRHQTENIHQVLFNRNYAETPTGWSINGGIPLEHGFLLHAKSDTIPGRNCGYWPHYSFRPSVIRTSAILKLGNYDSANAFFERDYADRWFAAGYRSAFFNTITCKHIGKLTSDRTGQNAYTLNGQNQFNESGTGVGPATKTFIVNLARRSDRKAEMTAVMTAADISAADYTFVTAVDGQSLSVTPEIQHLFTGNDFGARRGFIGCALSHYRLWQQLVKEPISVKAYTVFEDDITLVPDFKTHWQRCLREMTEQETTSDLLMLGRSVFGEHKKDGPPLILPLNKPGCAGGTFGYILTRKGAQKLLDYIAANGICHGIDYVMKIQPDSTFNSRMVDPPIVLSEWVRTTTSTVDSDIQNDSNSLNLRECGEWIFYQGMDQIGSDVLCVGKKSMDELLIQAELSDKDCNAFNSLGFLKSIKPGELKLEPSCWFSKRDGVWIKKTFITPSPPTPIPSPVLRVKMLCNWGSSEEVCKGLEKQMTSELASRIKLTWTDDPTKIDYWVILNYPREADCGTYDPKRTLVFRLEPWCGEPWQTWGAKQWGEWATPDPAKFLYAHTGPTPVFWICQKTADEFLALPPAKSEEKQCRIAHIASAKYTDPGQKQRIDFLRFLEGKGDIPLAIYGKENYHNFRSYVGPVPGETTDAIFAVNQYSLMCENNAEHNYITEKIWEPILCETLCFYSGPPNATEILTEGTYVPLDMTDFEASYRIVKRAIQENWWGSRRELIRAERPRILNELNLLSVIHRIVKSKN